LKLEFKTLVLAKHKVTQCAELSQFAFYHHSLGSDLRQKIQTSRF